MSKHTEGPWFSPDGKTIKQDYRPIGLSAAAGCTIGAVMGGSTSGPHFIEIDEEVAANTKLICAAPDLLEALEDLYALISTARCDIPDAKYATVTNAAAVIARARGDA